jgi:hypothetical protein
MLLILWLVQQRARMLFAGGHMPSQGAARSGTRSETFCIQGETIEGVYEYQLARRVKMMYALGNTIHWRDLENTQKANFLFVRKPRSDTIG